MVGDSFVTHTERLEPYQWDDFQAACVLRDQSIIGWTDCSRLKIGPVAFLKLSEVGLMGDARSCRLRPLILRSEMADLLERYRLFRLQCCLKTLTLR